MPRESTIPGSVAKHRFIHDGCRELKTDAEALEEALADLKQMAEKVLAGWDVGKGVRIHFVLTVERP